MSLTSRLLHDGPLLRITCVCCRPERGAHSVDECVPMNAVVLPLQGLFVREHDDGRQVVANGAQALFFNDGDVHRIRHPAGGDVCLGIEPTPTLLRELLAHHDVAASERERQPFAASHTPLSPSAALQRGFLLERLRAQDDGLAIEEHTLTLLTTVLGDTRSARATRGDERRPLARRRRREQVQETALTLAARPQQAWSLAALAAQVHTSPYHLARSFRDETGESLHQHLLRQRLALALDAVLDSDEALTAIGMRLGFSTPSHFAAAFRRRFGVSASALRQRRGRGPSAAATELRRISTAHPPR